MPRERVGDAYVRIHADGDGIADDVAKDFRDLDPVIRSMGREHGKAYTDGFTEEQGRQGKLKHFAQGIGKALGRFDAGSEFVASMEKSLIELRTRVSNEHGPQIGERLAAEIREAMQRGGIRTTKEYLATISNLRPAITRITSQIDKENQAALTRMLRDQERHLKEIERQEAETGNDIVAERRRVNAAIIGDLRQRVAEETRLLAEQRQEQDRSFESHIRQVQQQREVTERFDEELSSLVGTLKKVRAGTADAGTSLDTMRTRMSDLVREAEILGVELDHRKMRRWTTELQTSSARIGQVNRGLTVFSDGIGRAFGRGSRNNFLNFVGVVVGGFAHLVRRIVVGTAEFVSAFVKGIGQMISGLRNFGQTLSEQSFKAALGGVVNGFAFMGTTAATAGLNLIGLAAAVAAIGAAAAFATPLIMGLLGILTGLVATVSFAAASALPALVAGLLPLVAGIGTVVAAWQGLDDAQKEALKADLKPLTNAFKGLADSAADVLFQDVGKWARQLKPVIDSLEPGIVGIAKAIRTTLGNAIESASESPKFQAFIDRMNVFLPNAVRKLGDIFTNVFEGMGGVIMGMLPAINRFLGWLGEITQEFSDWANSREGRRELRQFFEDAGDSASALGDFLGDAARLLGELLSQTRGEGDQMFRQMARAIGDMVTYLRSPEGQQAIDDWIEFSQDLFTNIGKVIGAIAQVIDTLDNPTSREVVTWLVDAFAGWIVHIDRILTGLGDIFNFLRDLSSFDLSSVLGIFAGAAQGVADFAGAIRNLPLGGLALGFSGVASAVSSAFSPGGERRISGYSVALGDIGSRASNAVQPILEFKEGLEGVMASLDGVTGAATATTRALALQELQEAGLLQTGRDLGISARTLVSAFTGNKNAALEVGRAYAYSKNLTVEQRVAVADLLQKMGIYTRNLRDQRNQVQLNNAATRDYTGLLKGVPRDIRSQFHADGVRPTVRAIASVIDKATVLGGKQLTGKQIRTIISATGATPTARMIQRITALVKTLNKQEANPKVDLDTKPFTVRQADLAAKLKTTDKKKTTPKADLDLKEFNLREGELKRSITAMSRLEASPKAKIDLGQFNNDRSRIVQDLANLPDGHVTVWITERKRGGAATARGGIFSGEQTRTIAEAGPEAVVPLDRDLTQVDPSVRYLSAIAQGIADLPSGGSGVGKMVNVQKGAITVVEAADGRSTAQEILNHIAATTY